MTNRTYFLHFLLPGLLLVGPGCSAFRAQVGLGIGVGADVQVLGMQHMGFLIGRYHEYGPNYGRGSYSKTGYTVLGPLHSTRMEFEPRADGTLRPAIEHSCLGIMPGPTGLVFSDDPPAERWALEFGVALTFLELRMGVNPIAPLFAEDEPEVGPQPAPSQPRAEPEGPTASAGASQQTSTTSSGGPTTYGPSATEAPPTKRAAPPPPPPPPVDDED
ncbi:MAG: hypothetical protein M9894_08315 [Planctomycetes bacterium]|nr:hypothetical protein [Planctomycetota bacterium]